MYAYDLAAVNDLQSRYRYRSSNGGQEPTFRFKVRPISNWAGRSRCSGQDSKFCILIPIKFETQNDPAPLADSDNPLHSFRFVRWSDANDTSTIHPIC